MSSEEGTVPERKHGSSASAPADPSQRALSDLLVTTTDLLLQAPALAPALAQVFQGIRAPLGIDLFIHHEFNEETRDLGLVTHGGLNHEEAVVGASVRLRPGQSTSGTAAQRGEMVVVSDVQHSQDPGHYFLRLLRLNSFVAVPLSHAGKLLGTLGFGRRDTAPFNEAETGFLQAVSRYVALADYRIRMDQELHSRMQERDRVVAERLEIERQMAARARAGALGSIAAAIAHELNQPLSAAANFMAALRLSPNSDERTLAITRSAEEQLHRAGNIIRRIRHMARQTDFVFQMHDLSGVIDEALDAARSAASQRLPPIAIQIAPDATRACFDAEQIVQALANVVGAAADACIHCQGGRIRVSTAALPGGEVDVGVTVTGVAADPEGEATRFNLKNDAGTTVGPSIGLPIAMHLVEEHGGRLWLSRSEDGGTTIHVTLPPNHPPPDIASLYKS